MTFTPMPIELATERFVLTRKEFADAAWLAGLFTAQGGGTVTEVEASSRIAAMHDLTSAHGIGAYVLRPRDGGAPAGYAAIIIGRGIVEEPEIAYGFCPTHRAAGTPPRPREPCWWPRLQPAADESGQPSVSGTRHHCGSSTSSAASRPAG